MATYEYAQRVGPLVEVPAVLREMGVDPVAVLARAGLAADALDKSAFMIPFAAFGAVLAAGAEATACPHFGLMIGRRSRVEHYGPVGKLVSHAPSLGKAMQDFVRNHHRYIRGSVFHLLVGELRCMLSYSVEAPRVTGLSQIFDTAMASAFVVFRELSGMVPFEVRLSSNTPGNLAPYVELFGLRPRFNAPLTALEFFPRQLEAPLPAANPALRAEFEAIVEAYWQVEQPDVSSRTTREIVARLCSDNSEKQAIAAALGMHPRTLTRRLHEEETSFRELTRQGHREVASQLLLGTRLTVARIAKAMGYSDSAAFVKAFHHDTGMTPGEWRAQHGHAEVE